MWIFNNGSISGFAHTLFKQNVLTIDPILQNNTGVYICYGYSYQIRGYFLAKTEIHVIGELVLAIIALKNLCNLQFEAKFTRVNVSHVTYFLVVKIYQWHHV